MHQIATTISKRRDGTNIDDVTINQQPNHSGYIPYEPSHRFWFRFNSGYIDTRICTCIEITTAGALYEHQLTMWRGADMVTAAFVVLAAIKTAPHKSGNIPNPRPPPNLHYHTNHQNHTIPNTILKNSHLIVSHYGHAMELI